MAWQQSVKAGIVLSEKEIKSLAEDHFGCGISNITSKKKNWMGCWKMN
jgi:hypothetical protein